MQGTSIAASVLFAASLMGAGALAATSGHPTRSNGRDPVTTLAIMAQLEKGGAATARPSTAAAEKVDDGKGNLHVPEDYRARYRFIGSWAVAGDDKGSGSKEIHTVYASPGAAEGYLKTGHFEDGVVLVK